MQISNRLNKEEKKDAWRVQSSPPAQPQPMQPSNGQRLEALKTLGTRQEVLWMSATLSLRKTLSQNTAKKWLPASSSVSSSAREGFLSSSTGVLNTWQKLRTAVHRTITLWDEPRSPAASSERLKRDEGTWRRKAWCCFTFVENWVTMWQISL